MCAGRRAPGCAPTRPSSRGARSAPRTTRWWRRSWRTATGAADGDRTALPGAARARGGRARDQSGAAGGDPGRSRLSCTGRPASTTSISGTICAAPRSATTSATATPLPRPLRCYTGAPAESLVPVDAAGWRNVGTATHVDVFADAQGELSPPLGRSARRGGGARRRGVERGGHGDDDNSDVGDGRGPRATSSISRLTVSDGAYRVRLTAQRAEVNGPEGQSSFTRRTDDDADERGGTAGECRAPLPGAITRGPRGGRATTSVKGPGSSCSRR